MKIFLMLALLYATGAFAQSGTQKYRIYLTDKSATEYSLSRPEEFLSAKSLARRQRQGLTVDSTDLPVCRTYIQAILANGVQVVHVGKWENFLTVSCRNTSCISDIAKLPFVRSVQRVWTAPKQSVEPLLQRDSLYRQKPVTFAKEIYGAAAEQIKMSQGDKLHAAGFQGEGMTIAVIDAGFHNADKVPLLAGIHILGTHDFVSKEDDIYAAGSHGMAVLSCMAMNIPHVMVGTAPAASFWLLRSEDEASEYPVEEDHWSAAVEFADSVGVDVVNTSLGYYRFDDSTQDYRLCQLDGKTSLMSRQASHMADKGILLVCSAGNSGMGAWKKITPPADAENVLTVGAVDKLGILAPFSSVGNTADGRIKPDVMGVGLDASVLHSNGLPGRANGTSFSSPIVCGMVTCLWQACPTLTVRQLLELVRQSGDRATCTDNIYGYGVPDVWQAYLTYLTNHQ